MKQWLKPAVVLLLAASLLGAAASCGNPENGPADTTTSADTLTSAPGTVTTVPKTETTTPETTAPIDPVDYAGQIKFDPNSETAKLEVTVKAFIDGDTTHFNVPTSVSESGILKGRYLAVNTPESTGKVEEWGKTASNFTKEKLKNATSIYIESDSDKWEADSTGSRFLVWVWYKDANSSEYRNLNIELLQNGLAIASSSANNRYGKTAMAAIKQAQSLKLHVYSNEKDPNFYYGEAVELTLKELRLNVEQYNGMKVAFNGVITKNEGQSIYIEDYDAETDMYYGISVFYGFGMDGNALEILHVGNKSRIVGTVSYWETGKTYQVSGLSYRAMKPDDPNNIQKISDGHTPAYVPTTADRFLNGKVEITVGDESKLYDYAALALHSSISMKNLQVKSVYTTNTPGSSSNGALTLTCEVDGLTLKVRTTVLEGVTAESFDGKTIDVQGIVDFFNGSYQIKVLSASDITVRN